MSAVRMNPENTFSYKVTTQQGNKEKVNFSLGAGNTLIVKPGLNHNRQILGKVNNFKDAHKKAKNWIIDAFDIESKDIHLSNPRMKMAKKRTRKKKRNVSLMASNPIHFPKTKRGRPRKARRGRPIGTYRAQRPVKHGRRGRPENIKWWILDLYGPSGNIARTLIGPGTAHNAKAEAHTLSLQKGVARAELSGPYHSKPNKDTARI